MSIAINLKNQFSKSTHSVIINLQKIFALDFDRFDFGRIFHYFNEIIKTLEFEMLEFSSFLQLPRASLLKVHWLQTWEQSGLAKCKLFCMTNRQLRKNTQNSRCILKCILPYLHFFIMNNEVHCLWGFFLNENFFVCFLWGKKFKNILSKYFFENCLDCL